jgi:hypothetical protein
MSEREARLGALAVRKGFASENEVQTALELQKNLEPSADRPAAKVGEILVEMGALTGDMLQVLLEEQEIARRRAAEDPLSLPAPDSGNGSSTPDARLLVRSAVPLSVNGKPVTAATELRKGDILKIGNAVLQVEASLTIVPAADAPEEDVAPPPQAAPAATAKSVFDKALDFGTRLFKKKESSGTDLPAPAGPGLGQKLKGAAAAAGGTVKKLLKDVGKKRWAKDRLGANRRRDELLVEIARAAMRTGKLAGPEFDTAREALRTLDQTEHSTGLRGSATTPEEASKQRQAIKAARDRVELALVKLGYMVVEKGPELPLMASKIREVREIDDALAEAPPGE